MYFRFGKNAKLMCNHDLDLTYGCKACSVRLKRIFRILARKTIKND